MPLPVLTTNRHTPYLYLLAKTGLRFHVLEGWDASQRPVPANVTLVGWETARALRPASALVVGHGLGDFFALGLPALRRRCPYIQVMHGMVERAGGLKRLAKHLIAQGLLRTLVRSGRVRMVFLSAPEQASWRLPGRIIPLAAPLDELGPYSGERKMLLVVGNDLHRPHFDRQALAEVGTALPLRVVGRNPQGPPGQPAKTWEELKGHYAQHRAYLNVLREPERGYNTATLEAMGTGMPVLTLWHPTSPIEDAVNGLVARNPEDLIKAGTTVLGDLALARTLGTRARQTIADRFPITRFVASWQATLEDRWSS